MGFLRLSRRTIGLVGLAVCASMLAACSSGGKTVKMSAAPKGLHARNGKTSGKEYFSESAYGVKASPRVTTALTNLPRGGGRDQTGKPYQVRGKWYYPKEEKGYRKRGGASWYGDAFHGRLTANGEIYDMTHLTAAHPTMPLPSYARVTNMKNGSSVIVRVNDRGPYAHGRVIDLSRRAAEMLDYTHDGVTTVQVDYVGRAPLEGSDDQYLMASFQPGNGAPDPSIGMPSGVMVAMNGDTPSVAVTDLPEAGPIISIKPIRRMTVAKMGYASEGEPNLTPFSSIDDSSGWKAGQSNRIAGEYIALGTFDSSKRAKALAGKLARFGKINTVTEGQRISLSLQPKRAGDIDKALRAAWAAGATDAMTVRP